MSTMRLFYALWPDDATREAFVRLQPLVHGRHSRPENLHLTLAFLGDQLIELLPLLKAELETLPDIALNLQIDRLGHFRKSRIAWAGMQSPPQSLFALQASLIHQLVKIGVMPNEQNHFKPHITLARHADAPRPITIEPFTWHARQVALVQSTQEKGQLIYRRLSDRFFS